jgi:hypothetical protein
MYVGIVVLIVDQVTCMFVEKTQLKCCLCVQGELLAIINMHCNDCEGSCRIVNRSIIWEFKMVNYYWCVMEISISPYRICIWIILENVICLIKIVFEPISIGCVNRCK